MNLVERITLNWKKKNSWNTFLTVWFGVANRQQAITWINDDQYSQVSLGYNELTSQIDYAMAVKVTSHYQSDDIQINMYFIFASQVHAEHQQQNQFTTWRCF